MEWITGTTQWTTGFGRYLQDAHVVSHKITVRFMSYENIFIRPVLKNEKCESKWKVRFILRYCKLRKLIL